jgi:hypothetical protein
MKYGFSGALAAGTMAAVLAALDGGFPAAAHHSHAMFDHTTEQTITGTAKAFAFNNPHVYLYVNVAAEDGSLSTYVVEMSHVQNMISRGITPAIPKPGDNVTVRMNPLNTGRLGGSYITISKDGQELGRGPQR